MSFTMVHGHSCFHWEDTGQDEWKSDLGMTVRSSVSLHWALLCLLTKADHFEMLGVTRRKPLKWNVFELRSYVALREILCSYLQVC